MRMDNMLVNILIHSINLLYQLCFQMIDNTQKKAPKI